tara:strand:- start:19 stop:198 length:180 start_codon:yes stop_codon:yes gene_type:complete
MTTLTINEQVKELKEVATEMFNNGKSTEYVNEALKTRVFNSGFSNEINVDAIQYLAKQK